MYSQSTASTISVLASALILGLKLAAYEWTGSQAILSDALESIVNVVAAGATWYIIRQANRPADGDHPYGHGKLEYFAAAFEGGLVTFAALAVAGEAFRALIFGSHLNITNAGIYTALGASSLNLLLSLYLKLAGTKSESEALLASSAHVLSDVLTTVAAVVGLGLIELLGGFLWIDSAIALAMALYLGWTGYKLLRKSAGRLLDEAEESTLQNLVAALNENRAPGVIDFHNVKLIRAGRFYHIDAHLVVPRFWKVSEAHEKSQLLEKKILRSMRKDSGEIAFHLDPCETSHCKRCEIGDCQVRSEPFVAMPVFERYRITESPNLEEI